MEGADQVLAERRIDRRLAADAGIDLREQAGRDLHIIDAAPQRRRAKPARSPTTPPPSAITRSRRSMRAAISASQTRANSA